MAAMYDPSIIDAPFVSFENHLNYFHQNGKGLPEKLAKGLALYLNSSIVDQYFQPVQRPHPGQRHRLAQDALPYRKAAYKHLVIMLTKQMPDQETIDDIIRKGVLEIVPKKVNKKKAEQKIQDALNVLIMTWDLPRQQLNERSALTLLSLLALEPETEWADASNPLMGITPMMDFFSEHYGKKYAPNTRETVRRQTVHQFLQAALIIANPDKPSRPTNSPKAVYQIEPAHTKIAWKFRKL